MPKLTNSKKKPGRCQVKFCRRPCGKRYIAEYKKYQYYAICWRCKSRQLKERHPATYVLNALRQSARRRGIPCTLTVAEFKEFCAKTGYLTTRGREARSMTIDRIDRDKGYSLDNIRLLSHEENSAQGADNTPRDERESADPDTLPEPAQDSTDQCDNEPF